MWRIEFSSSEFLPLLPEQCQGNPGVYGFELAWWLAQALAARGVVTSYPLGEDWGWLIEHIDLQESEFTIGCASMAEDGEGYAGKEVAWSIFIRPHTTLKQRLKGQTHKQEVERLGQHVIASLQQRGIAPVQSKA
ncbi:hypothetical protein [Thiocystis violacea]|uniref:hypothetical protein n=1 Tax=Thiocystis violacea TaxID=13725 RepID=UPI001905B213|nr:hypothetical protein [Thiocystis violacea]MBK1725328.1 hypothetical protein [Thiocystis violacea]